MPFSLMKFFKLRQEKEDTMADLDAVTSNIGEIETTSYRQLQTADTPSPPAVSAVREAGLNNTAARDELNNYVPIRRSSTKKRTVPSILREDVFKTDVNTKNETTPVDGHLQQTPATDKTDDSPQQSLDSNKPDSDSQKTQSEDKTEDKLDKSPNTDNAQKVDHKENEGKVRKSKIPKSVSFSKNLVHDSSAGDSKRNVIRRSSTRTRTIPTILKSDFMKGEQNEEQENARKTFYFGLKDKKEDSKLS